jgi:putative ATPase
VENHFRVLDLNAQTGLFSWEALRRVPQGAVWSLCENATIAVGMREMSAHLNEIDRPTILEGEFGDLEEIILSVEESMRFETIVGRDALGSRPDKAEIFRALRRRTAATAQLALVETVRKRAQRLTALVNLEDSLDADLASRVRVAEEAIYADETNPQINWDGEDLVEALADAGFEQATCRLQTITSLRRMTPKLLEHWFSQGGDKLKTFAWHLRRHLEELEVVEIRKLFERQLVNKDVKWTMTYAIVTASSQGESPDSSSSG